MAPLLGDDADPASVSDLGPVDASVAAYLRIDWPDAVERTTTIVDPAIERFRELLAMTPEEDRETVQILFDHEVALKHFAERELAGDSKTSLAPVRTVIARARA